MTAGVDEESIQLQTGDRLDLYVRYWRNQTAPIQRTLVVAHGIGEHSGRYGGFAQWFCARGAEVYALDHRGHGLSGGQRGHTPSLRLLVDDLERVVAMAVHRAARRVVLVGHSIGALVAIAYALAHPEPLDRAIFSAPPLVIRARIPTWKRILGRVLPILVPRFSLANEIDIQLLSHDPAIVAAYRDDPLVHNRISVRFYRETFGRAEELIARAPELHVPFLLLHGEADGLADPRGSERFFARSTAPGRAFRLYPGLYHEILNEPERERVFEDIESWLSKPVEAS